MQVASEGEPPGTEFAATKEFAGSWDEDLAPPAQIEQHPSEVAQDGTARKEAEDVKEEEEVVAPAPVVIPGKVKIMQRRREDNSEHPQKGSGRDDDGKKDLSKLPFEEREQVYQQARARIFGASDTANGPSELPEIGNGVAGQDAKAEQRRKHEMRLAQDRANDMKDPAYNRSLWCNMPNPYGGHGQTSYNAAPSDPSNDPQVKALEAAQAAMAARRAQAMFAQAGLYNPPVPPGSWAAPYPGTEHPSQPSPALPSPQQLAQMQLQLVAQQQQLQMRAPNMTPQQFQQAQIQLQVQVQQYQQMMLLSQQRPPLPVGLQQNPGAMNS